jgi:hypothetical protein
MNQSRVATTSDLRTTEPIRSRFSEVAVQCKSSALAEQYVNTNISFSNHEVLKG